MPGEMASVARELSSLGGVLEPLQAETTIEGQVAGLRATLGDNAELPVTLIGWSWGAMLGFIFTAQHSTLVKKLILVSSAVFEDRYVAGIMTTRLSRLTEAERDEVLSLVKDMDGPAVRGKNNLMARFGRLMDKADSCDPLPYDGETIRCRYKVYQGVWEQAKVLRSSGRLLELGQKIRCPVLAIHGDYDPHPSEGIRGPLSRVLKDFRFILLKDCGHHPWLERAARDRFYGILKNEVG